MAPHKPKTMEGEASFMKILGVRAASAEKAYLRGADELMERCEYALENQPEALHSARAIYRAACRMLYAALEQPCEEDKKAGAAP
jgi:hypothetical protein